MKVLTGPQDDQDHENICRAHPWHKEALKVVEQNKQISELVFRQEAADVK